MHEGADHRRVRGSRASTTPLPPITAVMKVSLYTERNATPRAVSRDRMMAASRGKEFRLCTAFLISSLNEFDTNLPAHSSSVGSEKSPAWTALVAVAKRPGWRGSSLAWQERHTRSGLCNLCTATPKSGGIITRSLEHRSQKTWPHPRQWWRRRTSVKGERQAWHTWAASSGTHLGLAATASGPLGAGSSTAVVVRSDVIITCRNGPSKTGL